MATVPGLAVVVCWMTLLLEAGAIVFVWRPLPRRLWLIGITGVHLGIAALMNLWSFSAVMILFDVAAFGVPAASLGARAGDPPANADGVHELELHELERPRHRVAGATASIFSSVDSCEPSRQRAPGCIIFLLRH